MDDERNKLATEILLFAETRYGKREQGFNYHGVVYGNHIPVCNFEGNNVTIGLTDKAKNNLDHFVSEFSHEVAHLIFGSNEKQGNYLEEGLATNLQDESLRHFRQSTILPWDGKNKSYERAYNLVTPLLDINPSFVKTIRERTAKKLCDISETELKQLFPDLNLEQTNLLFEIFRP